MICFLGLLLSSHTTQFIMLYRRCMNFGPINEASKFIGVNLFTLPFSLSQSLILGFLELRKTREWAQREYPPAMTRNSRPLSTPLLPAPLPLRLVHRYGEWRGMHYYVLSPRLVDSTDNCMVLPLRLSRRLGGRVDVGFAGRITKYHRNLCQVLWSDL